MRDTLFISHANPEDNEFSLWLALQLAKEGYPVWCDLVKLIGGEDFWTDIEETIRTRTCKFLYVLSRSSNHKPGPLKELLVAENVARADTLTDFIIPLHIDDLPHREISIQLARLNAIGFQNGWATGLRDVLRKLAQDGVATSTKINPDVVTEWWRAHYNAERGLRNEPEEYLSNWFPIISAPQHIYFHELQGPLLEKSDLPANAPYPAFRHKRYVVSFARAEDLADWLGGRSAIGDFHSYDLSETLNANSPVGFRDSREARHFVNRLLRMTWEYFIMERQLPGYRLSHGGLVFYFVKDLVPNDTIAFAGVDGKRGLRQVVGYRSRWNPRAGLETKRYWHFGVQFSPVTYPPFAWVVKPHVLFSDDGTLLWESKLRLHRARRSQCKDWWNPEWRDRTLAAMTWLAAGGDSVMLEVSKDAAIEVGAKPMLFMSPVSYVDPDGRRQFLVDEDKDIEDEDGPEDED